MFYQIPLAEARLIYQRLWQPDGLYDQSVFDEVALSNTESIFHHDTGMTVPVERHKKIEHLLIKKRWGELTLLQQKR